MLLFFSILAITIGVNLFIIRSGIESRRKINNQEAKFVDTPLRLSGVSRYIINEYKSLPPEHKTFGDITDVLNALDIKHGFPEVEFHFRNQYSLILSEHSHPDMHYDDCIETSLVYLEKESCPFIEYSEIYFSIINIKEEIKAQAKILAVAGVQHRLDEVAVLTKHLQEESLIIREVTKNLT
jgi:hypothetical protein